MSTNKTNNINSSSSSSNNNNNSSNNNTISVISKNYIYNNNPITVTPIAPTSATIVSTYGTTITAKNKQLQQQQQLR